MVDGYRPRDELVYLTYNTLGRQAGAGRAARGPHPVPVRLPRRARSAGGHRRTAAQRVRRRRLGVPADARRARRRRRPLFDVVSQIQMDRWSRGRVVLIGDAAGCISLLGGEGTGLAMTEAYVLAGESRRRRPSPGVRGIRGAAAPSWRQAVRCG